MAREDEIVTTDIHRKARQQLKVLASLEGQSMREWLEWSINMAYQSKVGSKRKHINH